MNTKLIGRAVLFLVFVAGFTGCTTGKHVDKRIWAKLTATQLFFFEEKENSLQLHFSITNNSSDTIDPPIESSCIVLDGVELPGSVALINGGERNQLWEKLPGHCRVFFSRTLSSAQLGALGKHTIVWKGDGFETDPIRITVRKHPQP